MKIAVAAGGVSDEREVSMLSAAMVARSLAGAGHRVAVVDIGRDVTAPPVFTSDMRAFSAPRPSRAAVSRGRELGRGVVEMLAAADAVFITAHGGAGEDGRLQAVLEAEGIPFTGSRHAACVLAADKHLCKLIMTACGVETAPWVLPGEGECVTDAALRLGLPCVVKPRRGGSSIGVRKITRPVQLVGLEVCEGCFAEGLICGRELTVGILGGRALPAAEIIAPDGCYGFEAKYTPGATREICPAELGTAEEELLAETAMRLHNALTLGSYSRIDFILTPDGHAVCLEANALPGMTPTSLLPLEAAAAGISFERLCGEILREAFRG